MQRLLSQIGRSQRLTVVNLLKRSNGLTVKEIAAKLKMSYMGIKQICLDLEKDGYLDVFRRHRGVGRPELVYRVTDKTQSLFPQADNALAVSLLERAKKLFGAQAASKILYLHFQEKAAEYAAKVSGATLLEKTRALVALRDKEGYMADVETEPRLRMIERNQPMKGLVEAYPEIVTLERDMFQKLLGAPVLGDMKNLTSGERVFTVG